MPRELGSGRKYKQKDNHETNLLVVYVLVSSVTGFWPLTSRVQEVPWYQQRWGKSAQPRRTKYFAIEICHKEERIWDGTVPG